MKAALLALAARLRDQDAATLRRYADARGAEILERVAADIEAAVADADAESLTLAEAALASGFSQDHLRHLVASGQIPNAGKRGAPRIRRADLPRKPAKADASRAGGYDPDAHALSLLSPKRAS